MDPYREEGPVGTCMEMQPWTGSSLLCIQRPVLGAVETSLLHAAGKWEMKTMLGAARALADNHIQQLCLNQDASPRARRPNPGAELGHSSCREAPFPTSLCTWPTCVSMSQNKVFTLRLQTIALFLLLGLQMG